MSARFKIKYTILIVLCPLILGASFLGGCAPRAREAADLAVPPPSVSLVAVGDNLPHLSLIRWCATAEGFDFSPLYAPVTELISGAEMAFVNQEAPLATASAPAGYPKFNAPPEMGLALAQAGFTVVGQANNHALDQGVEGLYATADFWQGVEGVTALGINRSAEERRRIAVTEAGGYSFAWLAYSYGSNVFPGPEGAYALNLMERESMAEDIARARELADAVIVSLHWGEECQSEPTAEQRELARFLADAGVALVIGHHPHVLQPVEWITGRDGQQMLVAYSLGNFISGQNRRETMLGGMLRLRFVADEQGLTIAEAGVLPLVTHYERGYTNYAVYPLYAYPEQLARRHYLNDLAEPVSIEYFRRLARDILGDFYLAE